MKKLFLILVTMCVLCSGALADQTVTFQWDANNPAPDGYRLFQRMQSGSYDYSSPVWDGIEITHSIVLPNGAYAFIVRAYVGSSESGDSNEVLFSVEDVPPPVIIPGRPKQLVISFE